MTFVIRIKLSLLAVATLFTFAADADGQIFRRMRDNIRGNYAPQTQARPVQVAPQPIRPGQPSVQPQSQYGQSLTPYSRLTPQQRSASTTAQPSTQTPNLKTPIPGASANNQNAKPDQMNVRVVTYYDPRTGRTYQRSYLVPSNNGASDQAGNQRVAGADTPSSAAPKRPLYDKIPKPVAATPSRQAQPRPSVSVVQQDRFNIPPIRIEQPTTQAQQTAVATQQMPILSGPQTIAATPAITATPTIASPETMATVIDSPTQQPEPALGIVIDSDPIDAGNDIRIDTAVTPATVTSNDISVGSMEPQGVPATAFSVLEGPEDSEETSPTEPNVDIEIDANDEIEAFFGQ